MLGIRSASTRALRIRVWTSVRVGSSTDAVIAKSSLQAQCHTVAWRSRRGVVGACGCQRRTDPTDPARSILARVRRLDDWSSRCERPAESIGPERARSPRHCFGSERKMIDAGPTSRQTPSAESILSGGVRPRDDDLPERLDRTVDRSAADTVLRRRASSPDSSDAMPCVRLSTRSLPNPGACALCPSWRLDSPRCPRTCDSVQPGSQWSSIPGAWWSLSQFCERPLTRTAPRSEVMCKGWGSTT